jgi:hypothetical protein
MASFAQFLHEVAVSRDVEFKTVSALNLISNFLVAHPILLSQRRENATAQATMVQGAHFGDGAPHWQ